MSFCFLVIFFVVVFILCYIRKKLIKLKKMPQKTRNNVTSLLLLLLFHVCMYVNFSFHLHFKSNIWFYSMFVCVLFCFVLNLQPDSMSVLVFSSIISKKNPLWIYYIYIHFLCVSIVLYYKCFDRCANGWYKMDVLESWDFQAK